MNISKKKKIILFIHFYFFFLKNKGCVNIENEKFNNQLQFYEVCIIIILYYFNINL